MRITTALLGLIVSTAAADACDCAPPPPPKKALEQAAAVFTGKVVGIDADEKGSFNVVTFYVENAWKGVDRKTITISTAKNGAACGYGFKKDGTYLVYCHPAKPGGGLWTGLCSRTRPLADAAADFEEIGKGELVRAK